MDLDDFDGTGVPIEEDDPFAESGVVPGLVVTSLVPATRVYSIRRPGMATAARKLFGFHRGSRGGDSDSEDEPPPVHVPTPPDVVPWRAHTR